MEGSPILAAFARQSQRVASGSQDKATAASPAPANHPQSPPQGANAQNNNMPRRKRRLQHVLTNTQRFKIVRWMIADAEINSLEGLCARTVRHFPKFFRGATNANIMRASRYWRDRLNITSAHERHSKKKGMLLCVPLFVGSKKNSCKAKSGRGRKQAPWVRELYSCLLSEFDRFRKSGVRFNARLLLTLAHRVIVEDQDDYFGPNIRDPKTGKLIKEHVNPRWIQHFMQCNNIVRRSQTGKLILSDDKMELVQREVAHHLGGLHRDFRDGKVQDGDIFNADETHFVINMHSHSTLAKRGEEEVKYADVVSGDKGMNMMVMLSGGVHGVVCTPFIIFKNENSLYPIGGVPDNVPGACYRPGPKAWMDRRVFLEWLRERRAISALSNGRKRILYMENVGSHVTNEETQRELEKLNTEIRFFPENATYLVQPADSFVIQKIKCLWRAKWDDKKMEVIRNKSWADPRKGSGKLINPDKSYFLKMAGDVVREFNSKRDEEGLLYTHKAMIRCGMATNVNGRWEEQQLFPRLQNIIAKYRNNFDGEPVSQDIDLAGE